MLRTDTTPSPGDDGRIAEVTAERFASGGEAVTRLPEGKVCFVRGMIPGERGTVRITQEKSSYARGELLKLLTAAPERLQPECPNFNSCPGCSYLHLPYAMELAAKAEQLAGFLLRPALTVPEKLLPPFPSPERSGWRNKLTPAIVSTSGGTRSAAFHGADNTTLVPLPPEGCRLAHPELNRLLAGAVAAAAPDTSLLLRRTSRNGAVVVTPQTPPLTEKLGGAEFQVGASGFFQTNPAVAEELARRCVATVTALAPRQVLELYCGVGVFSILCARAMPECRFTGVELDPQAIVHAKINAVNNGTASQCRFFAGDAARALRRNRHAGVIIVDPPRSGLDRKLAQELAQWRGRSIVYISCAPDTLARDLTILTTGGSWQIESAGVLDMFPGTAHFESMVILNRHTPEQPE